MSRNHDLAELLIAAWRLANGLDRIPTSHGVLDRALNALLANDKDLPGWFRDSLTFADTRVGLRCLELPSILDSAQESCLTSEPNPAYVSTAIKIDELLCRRILRDLGIDEDSAVRWGSRLKEATQAFKNDDGEASLIETG